MYNIYVYHILKKVAEAVLATSSHWLTWSIMSSLYLPILFVFYLVVSILYLVII